MWKGNHEKIPTQPCELRDPPPLLPARGPPTGWGELVQAHGDRNAFQASPHDVPVINIQSG